MRTTLLALFTAASVTACSQGPGADPDPRSSSASSRLGADGGVPGVPGVPSLPAIDAGACAPSVQVSGATCSITIDASTCDCADAACVASAFTTCLGVDASVPNLPGLGGSGSGTCTQAEVDAAKAQFCADVDAALKAHGLAAATIDCSAVGQPPASIAPPTSLPSGGPSCGALTGPAGAAAAKTLGACDPGAYLTWAPTASLQLFGDGDCSLP